MSAISATRRKLAIALRAYLAQVGGAALSGYTFVRGMRAGLLVLPSVSVHVHAAEPEFDERESPSWKFSVDVAIRTRGEFSDAHGAETAEDAHEDAVALIEIAMACDLVRVYVNSENVTNRPVTAFHLDSFRSPSSDHGYDTQAQAFLTVLTFTMTALGSNADA